jgi:hypothetical protein
MQRAPGTTDRSGRLALDAMTTKRSCTSCGAEIRATAKFCQRCGTPTDGSAPSAAAGSRSSGGTHGNLPAFLPWAVTGIALLSLLAYVVGRTYGSGSASSAAETAVADAPGRAPDISRMSPAERADRLFQRVMEYVAAGKSDSVQFFAPMAIQSQLALAPLDDHRRYDLGLLAMLSGDADMATAQADTILAGQPDHLLGLILAMRTAGMRLDTASRTALATRLLEVVDRERAKGLPEYTDHDSDITAAVREAANPSAPVTRPTP